MNILFFDTETTSNQPNSSSIVQLAAVSYNTETGKKSILMNSLARPRREITPEAESVHGISLDRVRFAASEKNVATLFYHIADSLHASQGIVISGYNIRYFDITVLNNAIGGNYFLKFPMVDLYELVLRDLYEYGLKLSELYENFLNKVPDNAHDAAVDCLLCADIFEHYLSTTGYTAQDILNYLSKPVVLTAMPFGKHKGKLIEQVPTSYMRWCYENFENMSPDLEHTLETRLGL